MTVADLVMTGRYVHLGWLKRPGRRDLEAVRQGLDRLKISDLAERQIGELSGGQQQRTLLTTVDPLHAQVIGLSSERMRCLLLVLMALSVVTAIQAVGVVLTSALLVTPAATASLLTRRHGRMSMLAVLFSVVSSVIGLYASYYLSISSGGAIVLSCTTLFGIVFVLKLRTWPGFPGGPPVMR